MSRLDGLEHEKLKKKKYAEQLPQLQLDLLEIQRAYHHQGRRAIVVFQGRDAAGKGGAIRRLTEKLDPRGVSVHAIGAPDPVEQGKHYLWRFWQRLPAKGELAVFDRSWYGRVLVERVESFASKSDWKRAYNEINEFERLLVDDGVRLIKVFLHISKAEQRDRFAERLRDPYKHWKFTHDDLRNRRKWDAYGKAIDDMLDKCSTGAAPWHIVAANDKRFARVRVLELVNNALRKGIEVEAPPVDPELIRSAYAELELGEPPPEQATQ